MKPGPATAALSTSGFGLQRSDELVGKRPGARSGGFGLFRVDHGGVGREIAMRGVARRLDDETAEIEPGRQPASVDLGLQQVFEARLQRSE